MLCFKLVNLWLNSPHYTYKHWTIKHWTIKHLTIFYFQSNTPLLAGCPTIQFQSKNIQKRRNLKSLNRKRRNSYITESNCRTASLWQGAQRNFGLEHVRSSNSLIALFEGLINPVLFFPTQRPYDPTYLEEHRRRRLHNSWSKKLAFKDVFRKISRSHKEICDPCKGSKQAAWPENNNSNK